MTDERPHDHPSPPLSDGTLSPYRRPCRLQRFQIYREEDKHECNLMAIRVNALLTSQSFFLVASAILYSNAIFGKKPVLISIAALGFLTCALCFQAIRIGCRVLGRWHALGNRLIHEDKTGTSEDPGGQLVDCHLGREQPDADHEWSVDKFGLGLAGLLCVFWAAAIIWLAVATI
jgi:hypothetical protein